MTRSLNILLVTIIGGLLVVAGILLFIYVKPMKYEHQSKVSQFVQESVLPLPEIKSLSVPSSDVVVPEATHKFVMKYDPEIYFEYPDSWQVDRNVDYTFKPGVPVEPDCTGVYCQIITLKKDNVVLSFKFFANQTFDFNAGMTCSNSAVLSAVGNNITGTAFVNDTKLYLASFSFINNYKFDPSLSHIYGDIGDPSFSQLSKNEQETGWTGYSRQFDQNITYKYCISALEERIPLGNLNKDRQDLVVLGNVTLTPLSTASPDIQREADEIVGSLHYKGLD